MAQGFYTKDRPSNKIDVAVVEATEIKEDGSIVPGASVGATPELLQLAEKVRGGEAWHCLLPSSWRTKHGAGTDGLARSSSRSTPRCPAWMGCTTSP